MAFPSRIYLTGFMSSGKSTVGPILANVLGYEYIDLDDAIEQRAGKSTEALFADAGEAAFRRLERDALRATGAQRQVVVSLGGGALASDENLAWTLDHGTIIYLHVSLDALVQRLQRSPTPRPMLFDADGRTLPEAALRERVTQLMDAREGYYRQAHITLETDGQQVGETIDAVVAALRRYR